MIPLSDPEAIAPNRSEGEPELMDRPQPISVELRHTLRELEFLNRYFGGHRFVRRFLAERWRRRKPIYRVLDLGTGGGDFPRAIVDWARSEGIALQVDAVDSGATIVDLAARFSIGHPEIRYRQGDALTYDSRDGYDLVHCSLSLHHFDKDDAAELLRRMRALSASDVLITDLVQGWRTTLGVALVNRLLRHERMTIEDGDTSARRAYSFDEVDELARQAGWADFGHKRFPICRQALWTPQ